MLNIIKSHAIALGILIIVAIVASLPQFQGKKLNSHDILSWRYQVEESFKQMEATGEDVSWTNAQFCGSPNVMAWSKQSNNWFSEGVLLWGSMKLGRPFYMFLMCAFGFYALCCAFGLPFWLRILGALALTYTTYNPILAVAGHDTKLIAIASSAGVLAGLKYLMDKKYWTGAGIYTLFFAILFTSAHYQIIYYVGIALALLAVLYLIECFRKGQINHALKVAGIVGVCTLIGILPTAKNSLLTKDYLKYTMRGGKSELKKPDPREKDATNTKKKDGLDIDYAFKWSQGIGETFSLLVPNTMGPMGQEKYINGATATKLQELGLDSRIAEQLPDYWGPQPGISGSVYFGVIIVFLYILSLFVVNDKYKWWSLACVVFFILLSWGGNFMSFNKFMFEHFPLYNSFRTPSMSLVIPQLLMPLLGLIGVHKILNANEADWPKYKKYMLLSAGITALLVVIGGVCASFWQDFGKGDAIVELKKQLAGFLKDEQKINSLIYSMQEDAFGAARADGLRSLLFLLLGAGALFAYFSKWLDGKKVSILLTVLVFIDLFTVSRRTLNDSKYMDKDEYEVTYFGPRQADNQILQDKDPYYRVQDLSVNTYNDARPSYYHRLVGGYHPAKMQSIQDLIDRQLSYQNREVYNMLNTKYFIVPDQQGGAEPRVFPNPNACGNAWFVDRLKVVKDADEEMDALNAPDINGDTSRGGNFKPKEEAIIQEKFATNLPKTFTKDSSARIQLTKYSPNHMEFESVNSQAGFGVFSDVYIPEGWVAKIDGQPVDIKKVNFILRGLSIPAGTHKINFDYLPRFAKLGKTLGLLGSILVLLIAAFGLYKGLQQDEKLVSEGAA